MLFIVEFLFWGRKEGPGPLLRGQIPDTPNRKIITYSMAYKTTGQFCQVCVFNWIVIFQIYKSERDHYFRFKKMMIIYLLTK